MNEEDGRLEHERSQRAPFYAQPNLSVYLHVFVQCSSHWKSHLRLSGLR